MNHPFNVIKIKDPNSAASIGQRAGLPNLRTPTPSGKRSNKNFFIHYSLFLIFCSLFFSSPAFAQEASPISVGASFTGSPYSDDGFSLGAALQGEYRIAAQFSGGVRLGILHDMKDVMIVEPAAFGRWYFLDLPFGGDSMKLFAQGEIGAAVFSRGSGSYSAFMGALGAGVRLPLGDWHVEASLRGGYPFMFAGSLTCGYTVRTNEKRKEKREESEE
jgi:hypothetical protein